jgi:hypothetical protein
MAALHEALKALGPVPFTEVATDEDELKRYLQNHFASAQLIIESVPQPVLPTSGRARATSSASSSSEIAPSSARSETATPEQEELQKDWGKPVKMSDKDNPLNISVFKLSSKDGRGAWFARRSVHEGLSFDRWKTALEKEFEQSLEVQGGPGAGKVRGIAAEHRPEKRVIEGVGNLEGENKNILLYKIYFTNRNFSLSYVSSISWAISS